MYSKTGKNSEAGEIERATRFSDNSVCGGAGKGGTREQSNLSIIRENSYRTRGQSLKKTTVWMCEGTNMTIDADDKKKYRLNVFKNKKRKRDG